MDSTLAGGFTPLSFADAKLQLIHPPYVIGFARGTVTGPGTTIVQRVTVGGHVQGQSAYTDYPFRITGFVGSPGIWHAGETVTLRTPGGVSGNLIYRADGAPSLTLGSTYYVLLRDHGNDMGGNSPDRIVATIRGQDVFEVKNGSIQSQAGAPSSPDMP